MYFMYIRWLHIRSSWSAHWRLSDKDADIVKVETIFIERSRGLTCKYRNSGTTWYPNRIGFLRGDLTFHHVPSI